VPFGTLSISDLIAATSQTIAQVGEQNVFGAIDLDLQAYNRNVNELLGRFVERTTDRLRRYGGVSSMSMEELEELGTPDAQKVTAGYTVGFPLRRYGMGLQWTRHWMQNHTPAELAAQFTEAQAADQRAIYREIRRAVFRPTNYTFVDRLIDYNAVDIAVKAFINADGSPISPGPNGETFDGSTHTHYLYTAGTSLAAADVQALIDTVIEHYNVGMPMVAINKASETAMRGFTGTNQFTPILPFNIVPGGGQTTAYATGDLDRMMPNNRRIGYYGTGSAEVWVKPWVPAGYLFAYIDGAPPPLAMRVRPNGGDLAIEFDDEEHPLRARVIAREFGVGAYNRTNGAVLYIDSGSAGAYVAPTIS
jgi:hypothetical protein